MVDPIRSHLLGIGEKLKCHRVAHPGGKASQGPRRKNLIFEKKSSPGGRTVQSTTLAAARGGEAWRRNVWRHVFIGLLLQLSPTVTVACIHVQVLSKTLPNINGSSHVQTDRHRQEENSLPTSNADPSEDNILDNKN